MTSFWERLAPLAWDTGRRLSPSSCATVAVGARTMLPGMHLSIGPDLSGLTRPVARMEGCQPRHAGQLNGPDIDRQARSGCTKYKVAFHAATCDNPPMSEERPPVGRRDRKRMATHHALRSAALRLVAERGIHQVTVEEIAEAADVSVRTFFNHFPSKEDALVGLDPELAEELDRALASRPSEEAPLASLRAVLIEFAVAAVERSDEWPLRMDVVKSAPELLPRLLGSVSALEQTLVRGIAARQGQDPAAELYSALVASVAMAGVRTAIARWRECHGAESLAAILERAFDQIAAGLPPPPVAPGPSRIRMVKVARPNQVPVAGPAGAGRSHPQHGG